MCAPGGPHVQIKNEMYPKNIRTNLIITLCMHSKFCSVLALVAKDLFLWEEIALCEGRLLKEVEIYMSNLAVLFYPT